MRKGAIRTRCQLAPLAGLLLSFACLSPPPSGASTLVGDTVRFRHFFPEVGTVYLGRDVTQVVETGNLDAVGLGGITLDAESDRILMTRTTANDFGFGSGAEPCNCAHVSDIDFVGEPGLEIQWITTTSTFGGTIPVSFDGHSITADFSGNSGVSGQVLTVFLHTDPPRPTNRQITGMSLGLGTSTDEYDVHASWSVEVGDTMSALDLGTDVVIEVDGVEVSRTTVPVSAAAGAGPATCGSTCGSATVGGAPETLQCSEAVPTVFDCLTSTVVTTTSTVIAAHGAVIEAFLEAAPGALAEADTSDDGLELVADASQGIVAEGLPHGLIGQASIGTNASGQLIVSNIGSSGLDGVAIDYGEVGDTATLLNLTPEAAPTGAWVELSNRGVVSSVPDTLVETVRLTRTVDGYRVEPDYSALGATSYTLTVYDGDTIVTTETGLTGADIVTIPATTAADLAAGRLWSLRHGLNLGLPGDDFWLWERLSAIAPNNFTVTITRSPPAGIPVPSGNRLGWTPDLPGFVPMPINSTELLAADMPDVVVTSEGIGISGPLNFVLGDGKMQGIGTSPGITIDNIGSSGLDGFSIDCTGDPLCTAWTQMNVEFQPVDLSGTGERIEFRATGTLDGVPDSDLGLVSVEKTVQPMLGLPAEYQIVADFAAVGASDVTVEIYDGGLFVDSTVVPSGAEVARLEPLTSALITEGIALNPSASYAIVLDAPVSIVSDGMSITGDELRLVPTNGGGSVDGIVRVDVTATDVPSLTVTNETGTPIPEPDFLLGLCSGLMMLALLPRRRGES